MAAQKDVENILTMPTIHKKGQKPPPDPVDLIPEKIVSDIMKSTGLDRKGVLDKMAEFQAELDKLKKMGKYYFITYAALTRSFTGQDGRWNAVIDESPMAFIKRVEKRERNGSNNYYDFVILNTLEISKEEYDEWEDKF